MRVRAVAIDVTVAVAVSVAVAVTDKAAAFPPREVGLVERGVVQHCYHVCGEGSHGLQHACSKSEGSLKKLVAVVGDGVCVCERCKRMTDSIETITMWTFAIQLLVTGHSTCMRTGYRIRGCVY
jgi:hypothetical protein